MENNTISISKPQTQTVIPNKVTVTTPISDSVTQYPSELIGLPSDGYFYPESNPLSKGSVDIKYMTAKEEDILTSENLIKKGVVLERLLDSLIVTPGVNVDDLLIGDKNALFVAARRLAYGDAYGPVEITCTQCGVSSKKTFNLSEIKNKDYDFTGKIKGVNEFEIILPKSNKTIVYKLLNHADELNISKNILAFSKINKESSSEITTRLKEMIVSINGSTDKKTINSFVDKDLTSKDSLALRLDVKKNTPDVDLAFDFTCDSCNHSERTGVPLTAQFFWPQS